jgi:medium-chain acyl-[acyl-carrier-protein] hydrolase
MSATVGASHARWLALHKPDPRASLRLFCFPYAGSGAIVYRGWQGQLPPRVEVCPVQLPGRGGRLQERPYTRLSAMVEEMAGALAPLFDMPFAFFGHSMGGMISFELARLLRGRGGREPAHLFISGRRAPHLPPDEPPTYGLPEPEFIDKVRELNGTPREVLEHPELMQLLLPVLRADFEVVQTYEYEPGPPLDAPVSVFGGLLDGEVSREDLEAWRGHTRGPFRLRMLPGDHFFLHASQPSLLAALSQELAPLAR